MRRTLINVVFLLALSCKSDTSPGSQDLSTIGDAATDAASASYDCKSPPADQKSCTTAGDCGQVAGGCHCGPQPVTGIASRYVTAATACETQAAASCALGCPSVAGQQADDGKVIPDGTTASVKCDTSAGTPGVCKTYVP